MKKEDWKKKLNIGKVSSRRLICRGVNTRKYTMTFTNTVVYQLKIIWNHWKSITFSIHTTLARKTLHWWTKHWDLLRELNRKSRNSKQTPSGTRNFKEFSKKSKTKRGELAKSSKVHDLTRIKDHLTRKRVRNPLIRKVNRQSSKQSNEASSRRNRRPRISETKISTLKWSSLGIKLSWSTLKLPKKKMIELKNSVRTIIWLTTTIRIRNCFPLKSGYLPQIKNLWGTKLLLKLLNKCKAVWNWEI